MISRCSNQAFDDLGEAPSRLYLTIHAANRRQGLWISRCSHTLLMPELSHSITTAGGLPAESHEALAGSRQAARLYNWAMDEVHRLRSDNGVLRLMLQVGLNGRLGRQHCLGQGRSETAYNDPGHWLTWHKYLYLDPRRFFAIGQLQY